MIAATLARARRVLAVLLWISVLLQGGADAEPLRRDQVPEPLAPWVDWVLRGHETETCAILQGTTSRACVWPSNLRLSLGETSGSFVQRFSVDVESRVALPGDRRQWPEDVTVDGRPAPVFEAHGAPSLRLPAGRHRVTGRFRWNELPQQLAIPPATALLRLQLRGEVVSAPSRDAHGHLWLGGPRETPSAAEDHLAIEVHRRVVDEIPLRLTTLVELEVSGSDREIVLGRVLPAGFVPLSLSGDLPARLEENEGVGRMRVQVRPGVHRLTLEARHEGPVSQLALPVQPEAPQSAEPAAGDGAFDPVEIWAFDARPRLRLVDVEGVLAVDPGQTELPAEWHALPAYRLGEEDVMRLVARRRGNAGAVRDELQLTRTWHLDFDGRGATVADRLEGELRSGSRLEMGAATRLGRAAVNGADQPITRRPGQETAGLEVPFGPLVVEAESRVEEAGARLPAVGWSRDVSSLRGTLELPPGFRLFHAAGVDRAARTWIGTWTLLDLFVVMVASMACLRLLGPGRGALALIALALTYTEPGAPRLVWLAVLAAEALRRVVPAGRLSAAVSVFRAVSLLALVGIALPFAAHQVRTGLYPALERPRAVTVDPTHETGREPELRKREDEALLSPAEQMEFDAARGEYAPSSMRLGRTALRQKARTRYEPDPDASIPTGPGRPAWSWQRVELYWSGPVQADQELRLWLMPPWLNARLALLRTALLAAFVLVALGTGRDLAARLRPGTAGAWIALLATLAVAPAARAELPQKPLLDELRARLLAPPECQPSCASIPLLRLEVTPDRLVATLQVDAAAETAVPLPGVRLADAAGFMPIQVRVGDQPAAALRRSDDGRLWLRLPKGTHSVSVSGPLPALPRVELPLPLRPRRIEARVEGWALQGLHQDGSSEGALQLSRGTPEDGTPDGETRAEPAAGGSVPPFARVVRELRLGLSWRVETRVERIAPREGALVLQVPLLPGESVTTDGIDVTDGRALVSLPPGVSGARFVSALPVTESLSLTAPEAAPWSETWQVDVSPVWHLEATGIPGITSEAARGRRLFEWRPWPGETVELAVERPAGLGGDTLTIDSSHLVVHPGLRASDASLSLRLRTSQGGRRAITLPKDARLMRFAVDGVDQPLRQEGRQVPVPLRPGSVEVEIDFQEAAAPALVTRLPEIDLGVPSVNASLELVPLRNRWILHLGGPRLGPAVLFWPVLLLLSALAILLGRVHGTPLRGRHWFGLGLGLTQAPLVASLCVGGWLLALGWRRQHGERVQGLRFHAMQLGLVVLTAAALVSLFASIQQGLLGLPEMQIGGNGSSGTALRWYQDRAAAQLPRPYVLSVSIWFYRAAMLLWSLWIAQALVGWLRWGWAAFNEGDLWRPLRASREAPNPE